MEGRRGWWLSYGVFILLSVVGLAFCDIPTPQTFWFQQTVDHFNYETGGMLFAQRYLVVDKWLKNGGPLFFYTGNEGDIMSFYNNTGFMFDLAPKFNALVVFAEHRYYGQSLPFGQNSWHRETIGFLSVEQALADYAVLVPYVKKQYNIESSPVISFGGSYGGMLSGWFRMQYPFIVDAALAASAPIPATSTHDMQPSYFETVTNDIAILSSKCPDLVRQGFSQILSLANSEDGLKTIAKTFSLCNPLQKHEIDHLILWAVNSLGSMAMMDYPYATDFEAPLPGWPMNYACSVMLNASDPMTGLANAVGLFYNGTGGDLSCYDIYAEFVFCADQTGCGGGTDGQSWDYQACTEIVYFPNTNNATDMFPPRQWTLQDLKDYCWRTWQVVPRPDWLTTQFGGLDVSHASRIIFSNGLLDPWHGGGFLKNISDSVVALLIKDGAHHLDLRGSNPNDPESVIEVRKQEESYIRTWIQEATIERKQRASK